MDLLGPGDGWRDAPVEASAPAVLLATSGTTGRTKIVVWSHATLAGLHLSAAAHGIAEGEVFPIITSLMHGSGAYCLLSAVVQRATAVLVPRFAPAEVLDAMEAQSCTIVFGLPFMYGELAREQDARPRRTTALRSATVSGDVCPAEVAQRFEHVFGVPLLSFWTATEEVGATVTADAVGPFMRVIPEARVQVVDDRGDAVSAGRAGELLVASPTTSPGYWVSETEIEPLPDGVFHSGDLVREREDGVLEYMGRMKDLIVRGGSNIAPSEVEQALRQHVDVAEVAVVGRARRSPRPARGRSLRPERGRDRVHR